MNQEENEENTHRLPWEHSFAHMLTQLRTEAGMTQTELARRASEAGLSFHQQIIQRIENEVRPVRLNEAHVLARIFGMPLDELDSALIDTDTAYARADEAAATAARAAGQAITALRSQLSVLDAANSEARANLEQYRAYVATQPSGYHPSNLTALENALERSEWTRDQLTKALEGVTDDNLEPVIGDPARLKA